MFKNINMLPIQAYRVTVSFYKEGTRYVTQRVGVFFPPTFLQRVYCVLLYNTFPRNAGFLWHLILSAGKQSPGVCSSFWSKFSIM